MKAIIIDWDDTCLPTSLITNGLCKRSHLKKLEFFLVNFFTELSSNFTVIIVSNAQNNWVQNSCLNYLPNLYPIIKKCVIVSAATFFKHMFGNTITNSDGSDWKLEAFKYLINMFKINHLISIGDSCYEQEACNRIRNINRQLQVTSIKMIEDPTPYQIIKQLNSILKSHKVLFRKQKNLNLFF